MDKAGPPTGDHTTVPGRIIASHLLILRDKGFVSSITSCIEDDLVTAEQAVEDVFNVAADRLGATRDPYLRARAEDLRDICQTIRKALVLGEKAFQPPDPDRNPLVLIAPQIHPSAALEITKILEVVDFVSIGTNDLLQYLTASDRDNPEVTEYQSLDSSGLRPLLEQVMGAVRSGWEAGRSA